MISAAKNIRDNTEPLVKVPVKHLFDALRNPRHNIAALLNQIRVARTLDPSRYPALKTQLPYFVCGIFNPPYRRTDNFAYTEYFIIDIDHIADKGLILNDLRDASSPIRGHFYASCRQAATVSKSLCVLPKNATIPDFTKTSTKYLSQNLPLNMTSDKSSIQKHVMSHVPAS